jgi:hypothetical protein
MSKIIKIKSCVMCKHLQSSAHVYGVLYCEVILRLSQSHRRRRVKVADAITDYNESGTIITPKKCPLKL